MFYVRQKCIGRKLSKSKRIKLWEYKKVYILICLTQTNITNSYSDKTYAIITIQN